MAEAGLTLLRVVSNSELVRQEQEAAEKALADRQNNEVILGIVGYLRRCWDAARLAKIPIEKLMLEALRQRGGQYEPERISAIRKQGGSEVYMMITEVKCRAAESWLRDILLDQGTPPWDLSPTPIPDLSPDQDQELQDLFGEAVATIIQQQQMAPNPAQARSLKEIVAQEYRFSLLQDAQAICDRMKDRISDQFAQGGWTEAFNAFITDLVTFPAAFIKGPIVRRQRTLGWEKGPDGKMAAVPTERIAPEYERVDPFRFYPEPGITSISEGYLFEHHPLTRMALADMIGVPGYDDEAIRKVLDQGSGNSWMTTLDSRFAKEQEERKYNTEMRPTEIYDALEFWGKISGKMLLEWGMDPIDILDPAQEYDACVWIVGNYVIKAVLNYDPLGQKPYAKTSFIKSPGAFWGRGIPEVIADVQAVCNATARALVNNLSISSGPQVEVNIDRIPPNEDITQMFPWKIWQVQNDPAGHGEQAVRFFSPQDNSANLMQVYEKFSALADDHSGIPAYLYGNTDVQGAGRTSSGLSMLMGSAGKGIRQVVMHIDADVTKPIVERQYVYNMRYDEDETIKGDVDIIPKGAINLAQKEAMNVRRVEFLNQTMNPMDMEIMGIEGRAALLREVVKSLQMPVDDIIPSREKFSMRQQANAAQQAQQPAPQQQQLPAPTDPAGNPAGGQQANTVASRAPGARP